MAKNDFVTRTYYFPKDYEECLEKARLRIIAEEGKVLSKSQVLMELVKREAAKGMSEGNELPAAL